MNEKIKAYGYTSWLELFRDIQKMGLAGEDRISLTYKPEIPGPLETDGPRPLRDDLTLYMQEIRSEAFAELYSQLPGKASIDVVMQLIDDHGHALGEEKNLILKFLNKLPTR